MAWKQLGQFNAREHWTIYLLATGSNLFLSIPLYIAARASALALLPITGSASQFISSYGVSWGLTVDFLWTFFVFQGLLAILVLALAGTSLIEKGWRWFYSFSAIMVAGFVGIWLAARFLETLSWISLLQTSRIDSSRVYSELFWYGLGGTIFYIAIILVLRRSYNKLTGYKQDLSLER